MIFAENERDIKNGDSEPPPACIHPRQYLLELLFVVQIEDKQFELRGSSREKQHAWMNHFEVFATRNSDEPIEIPSGVRSAILELIQGMVYFIFFTL